MPSSPILDLSNEPIWEALFKQDREHRWLFLPRKSKGILSTTNRFRKIDSKSSHMSVPWLHSESQDLDIGTRHFLNLEQSSLEICLSDHKGPTHAFIAVWPMAAGMSVPFLMITWDY